MNRRAQPDQINHQAMTDKRWQVCDLPESYLEFRASPSVRSEFRVALERLKCRGYRIDWLEQKGWFYSIFLVRGPVAFLAATQNAIVRKWALRISQVHLKQYSRGTHLDQLA
jgi:hypothetical protein